jgi:hypothetical protein
MIVRQLRDVTIQRLLEAVFSVWSVPRCFKQDKPRMYSQLESIRRVGSWCEIATSLGVSCKTVASQQKCEHGRWGNYGVGSHYQTTTSEDIRDWDVRAVMNCWVCELPIGLQLLVVMFYRSSDIILPATLFRAFGSTQPLTEMITRNLPGSKGQPAREADNLTENCEPIF